MTDEQLWALGRGSGTVALVVMTVAVALGVLTHAGRPLARLPRFAVSRVHRDASLLATALVAVHVVSLFLDPYAKLTLVDAVVPFLGGYRPLWQGLGTIAVDLLAAIVLTSVLRARIGVRTFRLVHWATYAMWPLALAHGLGNGTDAFAPWFVGVAGLCAAAVAGALTWRLAQRSRRRELVRR